MVSIITLIASVVVAIIGSNGLWAFIQYKTDKKDKQAEKMDSIVESISKLSEKIDNNQAVLARTHILRFDDELMNGIDHSQEYFRQQLDDIDTYEKYCDGHPDFRNSYAVLAIKHIRDTYQQLLEKHEFKH
jgi:hypothetical protein